MDWIRTLLIVMVISAILGWTLADLRYKIRRKRSEGAKEQLVARMKWYHREASTYLRSLWNKKGK